MKAYSSFLIIVLVALPLSTAWGQDSKSALRDGAAKWKPIQSDIEIDSIADQEIPLCELVISEDNRQMKLLNPQKIVLRNFSDADGDANRQVDQWSYFQNGVEVYRELDTSGDGKRDQFRWLNSAGTRWGVDENGDGIVDLWKEISAEEVSREIVLALANKDVQRFLRVALKEDELKSLAMGTTLNSTVANKVTALKTGFANAAAAVALTNGVEWHQLNAVLPGIVPKGEQGNQNDLLVYENAAVTISDAVGNVRQLLLGTLVKIGDNNWRVLDLPQNYAEDQTIFTFIQPVHVQGSTGPADTEVITLMNQVTMLQAQIVTLPEDQRPEKHKQVVALLLEIVKKSTTQDERENWIRQIADTIMMAVGRGEYLDGKAQIATIFETVNKPTMQELAAHVRSRQIMVDYYIAIASGDDPMKGYTQWLADLEDMATTFPKTEAGLEGMMQLASFKEMAAPENTESIKWYEKVIETVPGKPQANKARGAIRRLTAEGKAVPFQAKDTQGNTFDIANYKGKFILLCFWDAGTAMQLPIIKAATDRFESAGLVPVGVNLDPDETTLRTSLQNVPSTWTQLYAPDGLEGALASYWGISTPPWMILYDKEGKVIRSNIVTAEDLQQVLTESVK